MTYYSPTAKEVDNMFRCFFKRNKPSEEKEKELQDIKKALFDDIDKTTKVTKKANTALKKYNKSSDITLNIFLATGGDKRN